MTWLVDHDRVGWPQYQSVEFFAGAAVLTACLRRGGIACATFEILDDVINEDILSGMGMLYAIELIVRVFFYKLLRTYPTTCVSKSLFSGSKLSRGSPSPPSFWFPGVPGNTLGPPTTYFGNHARPGPDLGRGMFRAAYIM